MKSTYRRHRLQPVRLIKTLHQILSGCNTKKINRQKRNAKKHYLKSTFKNIILVVIAITLADKFRINEIARRLPIAVKKEKYKQKRLLRFLSGEYPTQTIMKQWGLFVLCKVYSSIKGKVLILIDETDLFGPYKAIVAAIPFRKRAIPIFWKVYTNKQIQQMVYLSHNTLVWAFLDDLESLIHEALGKKRRFIWIFDRGFSDVKLMKRLKAHKIHFIIRVCRNVGVEVEGYVGKLGEFGGRGYFPNIVYHKEERIRVTLYCAWDIHEEEPMLIVSNEPSALLLLYKQRMKIEEAFRDLKSLFGFRALVLKDDFQERVELLWLLNVISMGLSFLLYEKSAYRWAKQFNDCKKRVSLIFVIKQVLKEHWSSFKLSPWFSLPLLSADIITI